ncbi:phospho-2-dehydro-3-deoxyheptonate aldolase 2 [Pyrus ussuriensis x Pyrus communis]|uniref:Phospho-2-dehydro-3-deoxyheptonate aldolase n=1 Tax=Pyrus ussuriensis x Pyrus communis TaxID=2448454 RepID=A0A5N5HBG9_9ROSA|nr:phospho-2-dehydro-3-deoxyheptonate aldolase 2 [Pyrus ussuriensis x Pyrus communis]
MALTPTATGFADLAAPNPFLHRTTASSPPTNLLKLLHLTRKPNPTTATHSSLSLGLGLVEIQAGPSAARLPGHRRASGCSDDSGDVPANRVRQRGEVARDVAGKCPIATGGYAAMQRVSDWNLDFLEHSEQGNRCYMELAQRVDEAIGFLDAAGATSDNPIMNTVEFWVSYECLHLLYEQALTREDSTIGHYYDCSARMLWVGERTRQLDGAHVEFLRGVSNPLGIKVSDKMDPTELVKLCEVLNPHNKPGRLTIITRMGAENMRKKLPHLIRAMRQAGLIVTWFSDPMHCNTIKAPCGLNTRPFDDCNQG